eukprot:1190876-Rhodomonas_salina.2
MLRVEVAKETSEVKILIALRRACREHLILLDGVALSELDDHNPRRSLGGRVRVGDNDAILETQYFYCGQ